MSLSKLPFDTLFEPESNSCSCTVKFGERLVVYYGMVLLGKELVVSTCSSEVVGGGVLCYIGKSKVVA